MSPSPWSAAGGLGSGRGVSEVGTDPSGGSDSHLRTGRQTCQNAAKELLPWAGVRFRGAYVKPETPSLTCPGAPLQAPPLQEPGFPTPCRGHTRTSEPKGLSYPEALLWGPLQPAVGAPQRPIDGTSGREEGLFLGQSPEKGRSDLAQTQAVVSARDVSSLWVLVPRGFPACPVGSAIY